MLVKWGAKQSLSISMPPAILRLLPFSSDHGVSGSVFGQECVCRSKQYATRDSNPQPPDSKSDTLSIAPAAR